MAKDIYHNLVKEALILEGWTITHDPLFLPLTKKKLAIDIGAEKWIVAENGSQKIAVEVKSFTTISYIHEFHHAFGQWEFYKYLLAEQESDRILYLAIPKDVYQDLMLEPKIQSFLEKYQVSLIIFDTSIPIITQWKS